MSLKKVLLGIIVSLSSIVITTGCSDEKLEEKTKEEAKGNCTIVECMKKISASNTIEEINAIVGFESTIDAMIGSDPIWKFDSKNWISFKSSSDDTVTIQATIDKESMKNDDIKLPTASELQKDLNNGSFTYQELVLKVGGEGILTSISNGSVSYTWVDKTGQRLGATFNNKSGKCSVASFR